MEDGGCRHTRRRDGIVITQSPGARCASPKAARTAFGGGRRALARRVDVSRRRGGGGPGTKGGGPPGGRDTETVVGQTAPSAQIDRWLHQTLSKMPVQNWTVKQHHHRGASSYAAGDAAGDAAAVDVGDSFGRMVIAPERVEALNGPIMRVDRIDGETVDVNMNLHFRAHFGKGQLEDATAKMTRRRRTTGRRDGRTEDARRWH